MKKSVLALAVLGAMAGAASAQTSVTVYGLIDVGIVSEHGGAAGTATKLTSGMASGSRLGFKGTEDLGGGLSALFLLENGFNVDDGSQGQGALFGRQAYVGLSSNSVGTVTFGRQYTPQYLTLLALDPFSTGLAGDAANIMPNTGDGSSRMNNSVKYASPTFGGVSAELAYGFGEVAGDSTAGRQLGAALQYKDGPVLVRLGYHNRNNENLVPDAESGKSTLLGGTYDFGVVKAHLAYGWNRGLNSSPMRSLGGGATPNPYGSAVAPVSSEKSDDLLIGATIPFGASTVMVSYIRKNDKEAANNDASQWAVGYRYALSKRTDLYTSYAHISNKNNAAYTVGSSIQAGSGDSAFSVGIRHTF